MEDFQRELLGRMSGVTRPEPAAEAAKTPETGQASAVPASMSPAAAAPKSSGKSKSKKKGKKK